MVKKVVTISGKVAGQHGAVDLEEALDIAGIGWFTLRHALVMSGFLVASLMETTGYAYTLPSARCDLVISNEVRGVIASMPYIAMVVTSHLWGYLGDTRGRRPMLLITALAAGFFSCASSFMPDLVTFALCKLLGALFIACPSALSYAYIGEMVPMRWRDTILAIVNVAQFLGSALVPLFAWAILPLDLDVHLGTLHFRGWRVLVILYAAPLLLFAFLLLFSSPESPKFLVSRRRHEEAFAVVQKIYAINKGKKPSEFPATGLKPPEGEDASDTTQTAGVLASIRDQTVPLFQRPLLKYTALMGFLQFGIFATLNGLYMWIPDILNRVLTGTTDGGPQTPCDLIMQRISSNVTETICDDSMAISTFQINTATNTALALISLLLGASVKFIGKKPLVLGLFAFTGACCYTLNHLTNVIAFALLLAALQLTAVGIGPINAYAVQVYPTALRGMAISLTMMLGRMGSAIGANVSGLLLNSACEATFYAYGGLLTVCLCLVLLLPSDQPAKKETQDLELPMELNKEKN